MATDQDRKDIDDLIKAVDKLKFFARTDDSEQLATLNELQDIIDELHNEYYDKSQIILRVLENSLPITITFNDESTITGYIIDEGFFNEFE